VTLHLEDDLRTRISTEASVWNQWARGRLVRGQKIFAGTFEQWLSSNRTFSEVIKLCPAVTKLKGKRVLEIGGSCVESVMMLRSGVARLDQIEISLLSQQLALF